MDSFRPLIGVSFCKQEKDVFYDADGSFVFVPLSGLASVNEVEVGTDWAFMHSFRPLIGVSFCKRDLRSYYFIIGCKVFVPLSGLASVNSAGLR